MSIVFAGSPEFAVPSLEALHSEGLSPAAVVTQPDRPKGRGRKMEAPPVKAEALRLGLRVEQPKRFSAGSFLEVLETLNPELLVVVAYGQILRPKALDLFPKGCINLHPSMLPALRGAAPINWAIINCETRTGLTTFYLNEEMDAGDIILQEEADIGENETAGELGERLSREGARLLVRSVELALRGEAPKTPQNDSKATFAPRLQKTDGWVDWSRSSRNVRGRIMGTNPWPGAATVREGHPLRLWRAEVLDEQEESSPGIVLRVEPHGIAVGCGEGSVLVTELQVPGKRQMPAGAFAHGYRVERGERWGGEQEPAPPEG